MTELSARIAKLPLEERIALEQRMRELQAKRSHVQRIPAGTEGSVRASFAQERLWIVEQVAPGATAYNGGHIYHVQGPLNLRALEQSLTALAARHDALRTGFELRGDVLMQETVPPQPVVPELLDLSGAKPEERLQQAVDAIGAIQARPFRLSHPPLWRICLAQIARDEYVVARIMHHIITDGWSDAVFWREFNHYYAAFAAEQEPTPLPPLPVSYRDFSVWQRHELQGAKLEGLLAYWTRQLADLSLLDLPFAKPRPVQLSHRGGRVQFQIDAELTAKLVALARENRASLYMVLLTAFQVLLHRFSGQDDIAVGSPIANRNRWEIEPVLGFFANTLVLRGDCSGKPTFTEALQRTRQTVLDAFDHQDLPFERLVEVLQPERKLNRNPLFDVSFALHSEPHSGLSHPDLRSRRLQGRAAGSKFDLSLAMTQRAGVLEGTVIYSSDLYDHSSITRMADQFGALLRDIALDPDRPIDRLTLLSTQERQVVGRFWNRRQEHTSVPQTIPALFRRRVEETPDAPAVVDAARTLTYRTLDHMSDRLAQELQTLGVTPRKTVGVLAPRSMEAVAAYLAVLKAGAVYVPLDPAIPELRLGQLIRDAQISLVLQWGPEPCAIDGVHMVTVDPDRLAVGNPARGMEYIHPDPEAVAYVMFTSGSTGVPKGVQIPHRAVTALACAGDYAHIRPGDVIAHASNPAFDAATFEVWGALLNGAVLQIVEPDALLSVAMLKRTLTETGITTLFVTTALFNALIAEDPGIFSSLSTLLFGGEAVSSQHVAACLAGGPPARLIHVYGPTETTTFATWHQVHELAANATTVPIGKPLAHTEVYLLDEQKQPVPRGVPGEIVIGGAGVACGYHDQPGLTAQRFIARPAWLEGTGLLYRTGDRARYQDDGSIVFLGRLDRQVKLRGFRIEPGEIEATLRAHPAVENAFVALVDDPGLGHRLIAWWTAGHAAATTAVELRRHTQTHLPAYMVPGAFVEIDQMPQTRTGKVDRMALPVPEPADLGQVETYAAPTTALEQQLAQVWADALGSERIGIDDNFFDLGGQSLLAVRVVTRVAQITGLHLPVASLFYAPTIRDQAELLQDAGRQQRWQSLVPVQPKGSNPPLFIVPPAGSTSVGLAKLARQLGEEQPVYGFDPLGLDGEQPQSSVGDMARHYIAEMRMRQPEPPYFIGGMCFGAHVALEMARQLDAEDVHVPLVFIFDAGLPFSGPTWTAEPLRRDHVYYRWKLRHELLHGSVTSAAWNALLTRTRKTHPRHARSEEFQAVLDAHRIAHRSFLAKPVRAALVLYQSEEFSVRTARSRWQQLTYGELLYVTLPNTTHRQFLLQDQNLRHIAEDLETRLSRFVHTKGR